MRPLLIRANIPIVVTLNEDTCRPIKRLLLAAQDMNDCAAAAELLTRIEPSPLARALETAIVICYTRPWGRTNTIGALEHEWLPDTPGGMSLHEDLQRLRNKVYAHSDEDVESRGIQDVSHLLGGEQPVFAPVWRPLEPGVVTQIIGLAEAQRERFLQGAGELNATLADS